MARTSSGMRESIREAALHLFSARGFGATSLHDIAAVAGCSKASLLYHFTSKDAILTELLLPAHQALRELDEGLSELEGDEAARTAVESYVVFCLRFRREVKILLDDLSALTRLPELSGVLDLTTRVVEALAGRSGEEGTLVAARMVLSAVPLTAVAMPELPDPVLRTHLLQAALRTLGLPFH